MEFWSGCKQHRDLVDLNHDIWEEKFPAMQRYFVLYNVIVKNSRLLFQTLIVQINISLIFFIQAFDLVKCFF